MSFVMFMPAMTAMVLVMPAVLVLPPPLFRCTRSIGCIEDFATVRIRLVARSCSLCFFGLGLLSLSDPLWILLIGCGGFLSILCIPAALFVQDKRWMRVSSNGMKVLRQQSDIFYGNLSRITIIKFHIDKGIAWRRVWTGGFGNQTRVEATILLAPVGTDTAPLGHFLQRAWLHFTHRCFQDLFARKYVRSVASLAIQRDAVDVWCLNFVDVARIEKAILQHHDTCEVVKILWQQVALLWLIRIVFCSCREAAEGHVFS